MKQNLETSKKKLINIFTITVFGVILLIGLVFFTLKYFREVSIQKSDFVHMVENFDNKKLELYDLVKIINNFNFIEDNKEIGKRPIPPHKIIRDYILLDANNNIIYNDVKDKISNKLLDDIIFNYSYNKYINKKGFLIRKLYLIDNSGTIIFVKRMHYSLFDYLLDVFGFLLLNLFFSVILYYVSYRLVNKVFVPVEENIKGMNDFIQNVGHELKTPLSVIDSNIQILNEEKVYNKEMINEIKKETLIINSIIDSLIKLTNISSNSKISKNSILETINLIIKEQRKDIKNKKLDIELLIDKDSYIESNKEYFYIFLSNIIGNAVKYNKKGGGILIQGNNKKIIIKDSGIGISSDNLDKIFNRFFKEDKSRNSEGFGIGLSLVKKISDIYGWKIEIYSEKGNGTEFVVYFN